MIGNKRVLAVIPARGGSKGIPDKNIKPLNGKPLIAYSLLEAQKSQYIDVCIFSTDSERIRAIAQEWGAYAPFLRPAEFSTDTALSHEVVRHAMEYCEAAGEAPFDYLVLLQPTTPLRTAAYIDDAIEKIHDQACDSVVSMVDVGPNHPARMYTIQEEQMINVMDEETSMRPRQQLPKVYIRSGDVYVCTRETLLQQKSMLGKDCRATFVPPTRAINIDSELDFKLAEILVNESL